MNSILLESANLIADKALQKGRELKFAPDRAVWLPTVYLGRDLNH